MAGFLYYVPGGDRGRFCDPRKVAEDLAELGMARVFSKDDAITACPVKKGPGAEGKPDGGPGCIFGRDGDFADRAIGLFPERQTWLRIPESETWVGFYSDAPPTPELLARPKQLPGHPVDLGDGQRWLIPVARGVSEDAEQLEIENRLPTCGRFDESGRYVTDRRVEAYAWLWPIAERFWDAMMGAESGGPDRDQDGSDVGRKDASVVLSIPDAAQDATRVLGVNYRVGKGEINALNLFGSQEIAEILQALIDYPTLLAWLKKKQERADGVTPGR